MAILNNIYAEEEREISLLFCNLMKGNKNIMKKEIKVVCGLIYDDEYHKRMGMHKFYHLNGDIETNSEGEQVYICSIQNEETGEFEDVTERVSNMPDFIQKYIELYTQCVDSDRNAKYIGKNLSELV